jgi:serine/threonine protein kinase
MSTLKDTVLKKQYFLRELAGSGGMADVYLAWDKLRSTKMAVKVLRRDLAENDNFYQAFEKEARLLEELQHPYIVRLYEFSREGDTVFIVMAWVDGIDLRKRIIKEGKPLSLAEASLILSPICSALNFAHQKGAFHCDIKPPNILLHENGRDVFLADFGVARVAHEQAGGGTLPYMAPEQFSHERVSAQTDIYALGITLYEMLSGGILPYRGETSSPGTTLKERFAWEHHFMPLPPLTQFNPALPQSLLAVIQKALAKPPAERFRTTLEFFNAFEQARGDLRVTKPEQQTIFESKPALPPSQPPMGSPVRQTPPSAPPQPKVQPRSAQAGPHLFARSGELSGQSLPISSQGGLTIGRGAACQVRLQEKSVSRVHATVFLTKRGAYVRDEGSSLGTLLNNQRIPPNVPMPVKHGDIIQIGYYQVFEFRLK